MSSPDPYAPPRPSPRPGTVRTSPAYALPDERASRSAVDPDRFGAPAPLPPQLTHPAVGPWSAAHAYPPAAAATRTRTSPVAIGGLVLGAIAVALLAVLVLVVAGTASGGLLDPLDDGVDLPMVALRPGETGRVGDYEVTVDAIRMSDDAHLAADGRQAADGTYVEAAVTATYVGPGVGVVEDDLLVSYAGSSDDWLYDAWGCAALTESPVTELPPVELGDTVTFVACMDVPTDVLDQSAVVVEDLAAPEFTAELWGQR